MLAFDDQNGNGVRDADEPLLSGVGFTLADANGVKGSYKSDGNSEPYCFGSLAAGAYTVQARGVSGLDVTTPGQWAISLANGAQFDVMYGARPERRCGQTGREQYLVDADQRQRHEHAGPHRVGGAGAGRAGGRGLAGLTTLQRARNNR